MIANTVGAFFAAVREAKNLSAGRENAVALQTKPILDAEKSAFLDKVTQLNGGDEALSMFWSTLLESET